MASLASQSASIVRQVHIQAGRGRYHQIPVCNVPLAPVRTLQRLQFETAFVTQAGLGCTGVYAEFVKVVHINRPLEATSARSAHLTAHLLAGVRS
jgi:hypothetical protein